MIRRRLTAFLLVPILAATPALAQKAATGAAVPRPSGAPPATAPSPTKASATRASNEAQMIKAQKASAARDKAWDARTRNSMTSICKGC